MVQPASNAKPQKEPSLTDRIVAAMMESDADTIHRGHIAALFDMSDGDVRFAVSFNAALHECARRGTDFRPVGSGGLYVPATGEQSMQRSTNDRRAALAKLSRSVDKLLTVEASDLPDEHTRQAFDRRLCKAQQVLGAMQALARKRSFAAPTHAARPANPRLEVVRDV